MTPPTPSDEYSTKAQLNWEVGKEHQSEFIETLNKLGWARSNKEEVKELFAQIRQNEYRRGKEDGAREAKAKVLTQINEIIDRETGIYSSDEGTHGFMEWNWIRDKLKEEITKLNNSTKSEQEVTK